METKQKTKGVKKGTKRGSYKKSKPVEVERLTMHKPIIKKPKQVAVIEMVEDVKEVEQEIKEPVVVKETIPEPDNIIVEEQEIIEEVIPEPDIKEKVTEKTIELTDDKSSFDEWKRGAKKEAAPEEIAAQQTESKEAKKSFKEIQEGHDMMFNTTMLISMCDFIFPNLVKLYYKHLKKDKRVDKLKFSDLKLTDDQIESFGDSIECMSEYIFQFVNPLVMAGVGMLVMYDGNIKQALDKLEKE